MEKGFDATYGARQLRRTIQKHIEDPLAEAIVRGQMSEGARLEVEADGEQFVFREIRVAEPLSPWPSTRPPRPARVDPFRLMVAAGRVLLLSMSLLLGGIPVSPGRAQAPDQATPPAQIVVKDLAVQGNRRVQDALILGRIATRVGAPFAPTRLSEDIRSIFALGFFDDVQAKVEDFEGGVKITFVVAERPFIRDITFAGAKRQDAAKLQEKIDLKLGRCVQPGRGQPSPPTSCGSPTRTRATSRRGSPRTSSGSPTAT